MSIAAASLSSSESEQGECFRLHRGKSSCMPGAAIQPVGNAISYTAVALSGKDKPYRQRAASTNPNDVITMYIFMLVYIYDCIYSMTAAV